MCLGPGAGQSLFVQQAARRNIFLCLRLLQGTDTAEIATGRVAKCKWLNDACLCVVHGPDPQCVCERKDREVVIVNILWTLARVAVLLR